MPDLGRTLYLELTPAHYIAQLILGNPLDFERLLSSDDLLNIQNIAQDLSETTEFYQQNNNENPAPFILRTYQHRNTLFEMCLEISDLGIKMAEYFNQDAATIKSNRKQITDLAEEIDQAHIQNELDEEESNCFESLDTVFTQWILQIKKLNHHLEQLKSLANFTKDQMPLIEKILLLASWVEYRDLKLNNANTKYECYILLSSGKEAFLEHKELTGAEVRQWCVQNNDAYKNLPQTYQTLKIKIESEEQAVFTTFEKIQYKLMELPTNLYHFKMAKQSLQVAEEITNTPGVKKIPVLRQRLSPAELFMFSVVGGVAIYYAEKYLNGDEVLLSLGSMESLLNCTCSLLSAHDFSSFLNVDILDYKDYKNTKNLLRWMSGLFLHTATCGILNGVSNELALGYAVTYCGATASRFAAESLFTVATNNKIFKQHPHITQTAKWLLQNYAYKQGSLKAAVWYGDYIRDPELMFDDHEFCERNAKQCEKLALAQLEIHEQVDFKSAQKAYRDLTKTHHPDKGGDPEIFTKIESAYGVLKRLQKHK